jgi:hypothetical protein
MIFFLVFAREFPFERIIPWVIVHGLVILDMLYHGTSFQN